MDISQLLQKPKIGYTPEHVELPEPTQSELESPAYSNIEQDVVDVKHQLVEEIREVTQLLEEVINVIPPVEFPVPPEYSDFIEAPTVTLSDYIVSLEGEDYGPQGIRDLYEEFASDIDAGEPACLMLPILSGARSSLTRDLELLSDSMMRGSFDASGARDSALWAIRTDIAESQRLRNEVIRAAELAHTTIDTALWAKALDAEDWTRARQRGSELIGQLRRMQSLLRISSTAFSLDWKSTVTALRDHLFSSFVNETMNRVFSSYSRAYNKVVVPARKALTFLNVSPLEGVDDVQNLKDILATSLDHVQTKISDTTTDLYAVRQKRNLLRIDGARAVGVMAYTKRLIAQIDIAVAGIETTLSGSSSTGNPMLVSAAEGNLGRILDTKKFYRISQSEIGLVVDRAPSFSDLVSRIPEELQESSGQTAKAVAF